MSSQLKWLRGPPKLALAQIAYWDGVFARSVQTDEWRADQEHNLGESDYQNAAEFSRFLKSDCEQARSIFVELGLAKSSGGSFRADSRHFPC